MEIIYPEQLWAGTDQSLEVARAAHAVMMAGAYGAHRMPEEEPTPYLLSVQDGVAVVSVRGSLVNDDSPYNRYYGVTGYADIRRAMIYAAQQPDIKAVLLDIESGGGAVSGVDDTANLVKTVSGIKPVYSFTGGAMASAAYWLGASAGNGVYLGRTAIMGSIGIIATHKDYSKMFKDAGIGVSVLRSGKYKALANSMEPLSDAAREQLQEQMDSTYKVFGQHVADMRGVSFDKFEATMGQGREFFGALAVQAKLADDVTTFDELMSAIVASTIDTFGQKVHTRISFPRGTKDMKQALTEQQIAALAAGAPADAEAAAAAQAAAAAEAEAAAAAAASAAAAAKPADAAVTALLTAQLSEANASVVKLTVESNDLRNKVAGFQATQDPLIKIAAASLTNMKVAMGVSGFDASLLSADQLVSEHAKTAEIFTKHFKVGGVAAVGADKQADKQTGDLDADQLRQRVLFNRGPAGK